MYIFSPFSDMMINLSNVAMLYAGSDGKILFKDKAESRVSILCTYDNQETAKIALEILFNSIGGVSNKYKMPSDKEIKAYISKTHYTQQRAANGKKTVRRGGS